VFLSNPPRSFIGLDIGTSAIKMVEIIDRGKRTDLSAFSYTKLPEPYTVPSAFSTMNLDDWTHIIKDALDKGQFSSDIVIASLPNSTVFTTTITQPNISDNELEQSVRFAASRIVPTNLEEMTIIWSKEGKTEPLIPLTDTDNTANTKTGPATNEDSQSAPPISVFVAAIPKSIIAWYQDLASRLDLELSALELSSFSLRRLTTGNAKSTILLCDIDTLETTFHIINRGAIELTYLHDYGSQNCVSSLINTTNLDPNTAKDLITGSKKHRLNYSIPQASINIAFEPILKEAKRISDKFEQLNQKPISQTMLLGQGAQAYSLRTLWAQKMNHQTTLANPWRGLSLAPQLDERLKNQGPLFAQAVCLAQHHLTM